MGNTTKSAGTSSSFNPGRAISTFLQLPRRRTVREMRRLGTTPAPAAPGIRVIVFAMEERGSLNGPGKVRAVRYFPPFRDLLHRSGVELVYAFSKRGLRRSYARNLRNVVICLYREDIATYESDEMLASLARADLVFNHPAAGAVIGDKLATHSALDAAGVAMPALASPGGDPFPVLSNAVTGSHEAVDLLATGVEPDPSRYNTRFIDTRIGYEGRDYYTTVRLCCVGRHVVNAYPRARAVDEGDPNTRATTTPRDVGLLQHLFATQVTARQAELRDIAIRLAPVIGPSFIGCDLLIERETGEILVCEPNFKLNDPLYIDRFADLAAAIGADPTVFDWTRQAHASAEAFLACCADHGVTVAAGKGISTN